MRLLPVAVSVWLMLGSTLARADAIEHEPSAPRVSSKGRRMVGGSLGGFYSNDGTAGLGALYRWGVFAAPSFTYFLRDRLGLGVLLSAEVKRGHPTSPIESAALGFGVQLVYDVPLGERVSMLLWPSIEYRFARQEQPFAGGQSGNLRQETDYPHLGISLPFVYHATPYVALGLGPYFYTEFAIHRESRPALDYAGGRHREVFGVGSTIMASF